MHTKNTKEKRGVRMWKINKDIFKKVIKFGKEKTGYARQTLYGYANGNYIPSAKAILKIANTFDLNPASFFAPENIKAPDNPPVDGEGEIQELDINTQYTFDVEGWMFAIVPLKNGYIQIIRYETDESGYGYAVKEKIVLKIK